MCRGRSKGMVGEGRKSQVFIITFYVGPCQRP